MSFWSSRKRLPLIDLLCAVAAYEKLILVRDEPLENLWAGGWGGGGEVQRKNSHEGKLNEKNFARQLILKDIHAMA